MFHVLVQDGITYLCMAEEVRALGGWGLHVEMRVGGWGLHVHGRGGACAGVGELQMQILPAHSR